jgi:hypothetical protein
MATTSESHSQPGGPWPGARQADPASPAGAIGSSLVILAGAGLLGLAGGLVWALAAPRVAYVVVTHGSADVINAETTGFIAADATYCIIALAGGLLIGLAGYLLAVRRYGPAPMAAIALGSVAAGLAARLIGEQRGLTAFNNDLLTSPLGTHLQAPLVLAGDSATKLWPAMSSWPAIAFWPLAACAAAGGLQLLATMRERQPPQLMTYPDHRPYGPLTDQ